MPIIGPQSCHPYCLDLFQLAVLLEPLVTLAIVYLQSEASPLLVNVHCVLALARLWLKERVRVAVVIVIGIVMVLMMVMMVVPLSQVWLQELAQQRVQRLQRRW